MRRIITALIFALIFLTACSSYSRQSTLSELESVKLFLAMNDDVAYDDTVFDGVDASAIADLVKSECPQGVGKEFVRATFDSSASQFTIYASKDAKNVTCTILKPKVTKEIEFKPSVDAPSPEVALVVNGQFITLDQIKQQVAALPDSVARDENTLNQLVNRMVNDELLRQESSKVSVTDDEIAKARASLLKVSNISESDLANQLMQQNVTMSAFNEEVAKQAKLEKLLNKRLLLDELQVTSEDAQDFYLQNPNQFLQSEQAVARFLLIGSAGRSLEQGRTRAQEVAGKINSTDFCQLVRTYSDDTGSKDKCGLYVIPRGVIDPNLEIAAFTTPTNQTSVVTTDAGIYFIQTLQVNKAQVVPYNQVAGSLQSDLRNAFFQQRLNLYLATLRSKASIISYLG